MQEENTIFTSETGLKLKELFEVVWKAKSLVVLISLIFFAYSVYYIKSLPDSYSAYGTYVPSADSVQAISSSGALNNIAKMAGLNIPIAENSRIDLALDILRSRKFLRDIILVN